MYIINCISVNMEHRIALFTLMLNLISEELLILDHLEIYLYGLSLGTVMYLLYNEI